MPVQPDLPTLRSSPAPTADPDLQPTSTASVDDTIVRPGAAFDPDATRALTPPPGPPTGTLPGRTIRSADDAEPGHDIPIRQVGRYQILSRLGRGGMASVYRAHDPQIGRDVAIKFLHASLAEDDECRERFLNEARAAGNLSHPNIVVVHDVGAIEGRPYMAMELIDGAPLAELLERQPRLPVRDVVVYGIQLARALDYAHRRSIVHRDIKPGNVMVLTDGQTVKVTDFGIAHFDDAGRQRTRVGDVLGTPQYMSPEQTRGEKLDGRSDLFSSGIVLYQMLAGERPFRGDSVVAIATRIAGESPPPLSTARPETPPALRRIVDRCLAKSPSQRFQSGEELAAALAKVLAAIDAEAAEAARSRIVPLRLKWALAMAAVVALVMGATATVVTQRQYAALMTQASGYGGSLARFLARQNAQSALAEEWEVVDVAVQEMMKTGDFERIVVVDPASVVRVASIPALVGQPYRPPSGEPVAGAGALRYRVGGEPVLGFEAPMRFLDTPVGRVALGIREAPLAQVARLSVLLMLALALVTVGAVAVAMYVLGDRFARPIAVVAEALRELARGNLTHRIGETRNDEFGRLYAEFDATAQALQARAVTAAPEPGPPASASADAAAASAPPAA